LLLLLAFCSPANPKVIVAAESEQNVDQAAAVADPHMGMIGPMLGFTHKISILTLSKAIELIIKNTSNYS
jgi:hypothetical protein